MPSSTEDLAPNTPAATESAAVANARAVLQSLATFQQPAPPAFTWKWQPFQLPAQLLNRWTQQQLPVDDLIRRGYMLSAPAIGTIAYVYTHDPQPTLDREVWFGVHYSHTFAPVGDILLSGRTLHGVTTEAAPFHTTRQLMERRALAVLATARDPLCATCIPGVQGLRRHEIAPFRVRTAAPCGAWF